MPLAIKAFLYKNTNFPCLVEGGDQLEDPETAKTTDELYRINARNGLRHLTYGTSLLKGSMVRWTNIKLIWLNFKALMLERDKEQLKALRIEMRAILKNAYRVCNDCDSQTQDRLEIFINTLLSNFPFMDPEEGEDEAVMVPQRIDNEWREVKYKFEKIDLSPKTGWRSWLLEERDHIFAYGMRSTDPQASPYLLFMGTTYLSGQGSNLSLRGDLTPGKSVGELHLRNLTELSKWIKSHGNNAKIKIAGHSQGGSMAMMVAAEYPEFTLQADCLNPAALHKDTLKRLQTQWMRAGSNKPNINVYTQEGDPVFIYGDGFLSGTRIYCVNYPEAHKSSKLAAHAHHFSGHQEANYVRMEYAQNSLNSNKRKFANDFKAIADRVISPLLDVGFIYSRIKKKITGFISKNAKLLYAILSIITLATCVTLMATGVLAPVATPLIFSIFKSTSPILVYGVLSVASLVASSLATYLIPKLTQVTLFLVQTAVKIAAVVTDGVVLSLGFAVAGLKALISSCFSKEKFTVNPPVNKDENQLPKNVSTVRSLSLFGHRNNEITSKVIGPLKRSHSAPQLSSHIFMNKTATQEKQPPFASSLEHYEDDGISRMRRDTGFHFYSINR